MQKPLAPTIDACTQVLEAEGAGRGADPGRVHAPLRRRLPGPEGGHRRRSGRPAAAAALLPPQRRRPPRVHQRHDDHRLGGPRHRRHLLAARPGDRRHHRVQGPSQLAGPRGPPGPPDGGDGDLRRGAGRRGELRHLPVRLRHPLRAGRRVGHARPRRARRRPGPRRGRAPRPDPGRLPGAVRRRLPERAPGVGLGRAPGRGHRPQRLGRLRHHGRGRGRRRVPDQGGRVAVELVERPALYA